MGGWVWYINGRMPETHLREHIIGPVIGALVHEAAKLPAVAIPFVTEDGVTQVLTVLPQLMVPASFREKVDYTQSSFCITLSLDSSDHFPLGFGQFPFYRMVTEAFIFGWTANDNGSISLLQLGRATPKDGFPSSLGGLGLCNQEDPTCRRI